MGQDIFDLIIVASLVIFTLRGIRNGFVGEVAGIASIVCGFWAARSWSAQVSPYMEFISDPSLRYISASVLVFFAAMLAVAIVARILKKIISLSFAGWLDKIAGALLGFGKGALVWALIFIVLEKFFADAPFLRESRALPYFNDFIDQLKQWLPADLASHFQAVNK